MVQQLKKVTVYVVVNNSVLNYPSQHKQLQYSRRSVIHL